MNDQDTTFNEDDVEGHWVHGGRNADAESAEGDQDVEGHRVGTLMRRPQPSVLRQASMKEARNRPGYRPWTVVRCAMARGFDAHRLRLEQAVSRVVSVRWCYESL
jgi:hypothetical protein